MHGIGDDPERARPQRALLLQKLKRLALGSEQAMGHGEQPLAGRRQDDLAMAAAEQRDVVFLLQLPDLIGNRGLGEVERQRRL